MVLALGLTIAALIVYILAVRRRFSSLTDTLLAAFVLTVAQVIVSELGLAVLGLLQPAPLALANGLLSAGVFLLAARQGLRNTCQTILRRLVGFLRLLKGSPLSLTLLIILAGLLAWVLWAIAVWPAGAYDGLAYHLPIAFSRVDLGNVQRVAGGAPWISSYPEHAELLMVWTSIFDRSPAFVDGVQWAFWLPGVLAAYGLARKMRISPMAALQGSAVFAFAPVVILQARVTYNDLMIGALCLIALNLLVERRIFPTLVAGIAMGLIAGVKYAGVLFPLFGGLGLLLTDLPFRRRSTFWPRLVAYGLPVLILGLPWYVANWINFGNPIWPFIIWVGDHQLTPGYFSMEALYSYALDPKYGAIPSWLLPPLFWLEPITLYTYEGRYGGLGILWIVLGVPAILYLLLSFRRVKGPALTMALVGLGLYLVLPNNWLPRYGLFITGLGAIGVAWVLHTAGPWTKRLSQVLLLAGVAYTVWTAGPLEMIPPPQLDAYARLPATLRPHIALVDVSAYRWLDANTYDEAKVVYDLGVVFIAPLWENDMDNRVSYVDEWVPEVWHAEVLQRGANYIFVERHILNTWVGSAEGIAPVYADQRFVIYRARPMELQGR